MEPSPHDPISTLHPPFPLPALLPRSHTPPPPPLADLGQQAVATLRAETGGDLLFGQLDVTDAASVAAFAAWAEKELGHVDALVNNAGIAFKGDTWGASEAKATVDTNYRGTRAVTEALLPLIGRGGRVVNVCSRAGTSRLVAGSPGLAARWAAVASAADVDALVAEFEAAVADGSWQAKGWPKSMYGVSKLAEAAYTRVLAGEVGDKGITVAACCPGWVCTDMSSHKGPLSVDQGADTPAWLASDAPASVAGGFWAERKRIEY